MKRFLSATVALASSLVLLGAASAPAATFNADPGSLGAIPDGTSASPGSFGAPRDVTFAVSGFASGNPVAVAVTVTLNHPFAGDLDAVLVAPNGSTQKTIFSRTGATTAGAFGSDANLAGTYTFSDRAPTSPSWWGAAGVLGASGVMPPDSFRASLPGGAGGTGAATSIVQAFFGIVDSNGTWTLRLRDGTAGDVGSVTGASIAITARVNASASSLGAIPDGNAGYGAPRDVTFPISGFPAAAPGDISLEMTINHTYVGDLDAVLIAPDGTTQATVFSRTGSTMGDPFGDSSNLNGTYRFFDNNNNNWWAAAAAAPTSGDDIPGGSYRVSTPGPSGGANASLTTPFAGLATSDGTWTLRLRDGGGGDAGTISGATLSLVPGNDVTAPAPPVFTGSSPASPGNSTAPALKGTAEAGSTVRIFGDGFCAGSPSGIPLAIGSASQFAGSGIPALASGDGIKQFSAVAYDRAGNVSACTASSLSYELDTVAPAVPAITATNSPSPANTDTLRLTGTADAGTTVSVYTDQTCSGAPAAVASTAAFASPGILIEDLPQDATTAFRVTATDVAGNESGCSAPLEFTEDSSAPAAPALSLPSSPARGTSVRLSGSAEAASSVRIFSGAGCSGAPVRTVAAAELGSGLGVDVAPNATTSFSATATDAVGNVSACSGPVAYTEDSAPPETTAKAVKAKVRTRAKRAKVRFVVGSSEAGSSLRCSLDNRAFASCGTTVTFSVKPGTHSLRAVATDAVGNADATAAKATVRVIRKKKPKPHK